MNQNQVTKNTKSKEPRSSFLQRITQLTLKEFKMLRTDKFNLFIAIFLPPLIISLFAYMLVVAAPAGPVAVAIVDYDSNEYVNANSTMISFSDNFTYPFIDAVNQSEELDLKYYYNGSVDYYSLTEAREKLQWKEIACIIIIPSDFSELIFEGLPGLIETIPDTSDVMQIQRILNSVQDSIEIFIESQNMTPQFEIEGMEMYSIPEGYDLQYNYQLTRVMSFMIFGITCVLTILVVVQEKTIPRLLLTPTKRTEILLAKYIAYMIILIIQIMMIYFFSVRNGLYIRGTSQALFRSMFAVGFVGISMGMWISTVSNTKQEANQLFFAFFIVIVIFSGIFIPIESMPSYLQFFANLLPLSHGSILIQGIITKGTTFLTPEYRFLQFQGILFTLLSFISFARKNYEV